MQMAFIIAIVVFAAIYHAVVYRTEISAFTLKASIADQSGVAANSHFVLTTTASLTPQVLEKYIKVSPEVPVTIKKLSEKEFEIIPSKDLEVNTIYTIAFDKGPLAERDFSWAYQIKAPYQVVSSVPGDKSTYVPVNSLIELDFNRDGGAIEPEKYIQISPEVKGRFEVFDSKVRFVPSSPLAFATVYTITIKKGMRANDTVDTFVEDKVIQFETTRSYDGESAPSIRFSRHFIEFSPQSDIMIGVNAYNVTTADATVYRFGSLEEYMAAVLAMQGDGDNQWTALSANIDMKYLPDSKKVFSATLPIETENYYSSIRFPNPLQAGYYAVIIKKGKSEDLSFLQVNTAASYSAMARQKSIIWLKDIATGKSLENVAITYGGKKVGQTGSDGVALFDTPSDFARASDYDYDYRGGRERKFFIAEVPGGPLAIPAEDDYGYSAQFGPIDEWWDYISFNKNLYLPTDKVQFWAVAKKRQGDQYSGDVNVRLTNPYWEQNEGKEILYAEKNIKLSDFGSITGELEYKDLKPGTYEVTFRKGNEVIAKRTLTVATYVKPAYKVTVTPNKFSLFAGDTVTYKVKAELFDGTPLSNSTFTYTGYGFSNASANGNVTLNSSGEGDITIVTGYEQSDYWPRYGMLTLRPAVAEDGAISAQSTVYIFGPHIDNQVKQTQVGAATNFEIETREVKASAIFSGGYGDMSQYRGAIVQGVTTSVGVTEIIYKANQAGTGYDPISKLTYPTYTYTTEERPLPSSVITGDANGISRFSFTPEFRKVYKIVFTSADRNGRLVIDTRYVYGAYDAASVAANESLSIMDTDYSLRGSDHNRSYKVGSEISLQLGTHQGFVPAPAPAAYIFVVSNNGSLEYRISDSPIFKSTFRASDIPNVGVAPGWFMNGRFHSTYSTNLSYDANERRLNISVTKDKLAYKPGDDVQLDIKVTDQNGTPARAEINVAALDEAVFSVSPEEMDPVSYLYTDIYSQLAVRASNKPPYGGGGAEKGGGGDGDTIRSNIQEMAIFKTITTDGSGNARVQFKLPDNVTSWRITSQALTKDLFIGKSIDSLPVSLPYIVDSTLGETYLAGDKPVLRLRTLGIGSFQDNPTSYSIESSTLPFKKIEKTSVNSIEIPLGEMVVGNHDITIRARNGVYTDAIVRHTKVLDSYFTREVSDFHLGVPGLKISTPARGYTTLVFESEGRGKLYSQLRELMCGCGIRLDQKGVAVAASELLSQYLTNWDAESPLIANKYQSYDGGIKLFPYASEDLELSAISAHAFGTSSPFNMESLRSYFKRSLNDKLTDTSRVVRALYGLSSYDNELILTKVQSLKSEWSLNLKDKVFVALTLSSLGAKEEAREYYNQSIRPSIKTSSGYSYVGGLKGDETIITTALVAALTAELEDDISDSLNQYVRNNQPSQTLSSLEQLLYIKAKWPKLSSENVSFAYTTSAKNESPTLKDGQNYKIVLSPEELKTFTLTNVTGKLGVTAVYESAASTRSVVKDPNLGLTRTYSVNGIEKTEFSEGDIVKVTLTPRIGLVALDGVYVVTDYLPSGLRPIDMANSYYYEQYDFTRSYPIETDGQKISFMTNKAYSRPITYTARVTSKGTFKAESALLQSIANVKSATLSEQATVIIK